MKEIKKKKSKRTLRSLLVFAMAFVVMSSTVLTAYASTYATIGSIKVEHIFSDNNNTTKRDEVGEIKHDVTQVVVTEKPKDEGNTGGTVDEGNTDGTVDEGNTDGTVDEGNTGGAVDEGNAGGTVDEGNTGGTIDEGSTGGAVDEGNTGETGNGVVETETNWKPDKDLSASANPEISIDPEKEETESRKDWIGKIEAASKDGKLDADAENIYDTVKNLIEDTNSDYQQNKWSEDLGELVDISGKESKLDKDLKPVDNPYQYKVVISDESAQKLEDAGYTTTQLQISIKVVGGFKTNDKGDAITDSNGNAIPEETASRVYVSVDGGVTWKQVIKEGEEEIQFNPLTDYVYETVYTFLHVLTPTTPPPTTPPTTPPPTTPPSTPPSAPPSTPPSETPTPMPTPSVTPTPSSTPTPGVDIQDEDVPLSVFIPSDEVEIFDEEVPLADVPLTADDTDVWYTIVALSACGLMILLFTGKRRKEA